MLANAPLVALFERAMHATPSAPFFRRALAYPGLRDAIRSSALICAYAVV
jgi:hypothetical protein